VGVLPPRDAGQNAVAIPTARQPGPFESAGLLHVDHSRPMLGGVL